MSRGGPKIQRADYSQTERSDKVPWLEAFFQAEASKNPKTAVEVARSRNQMTPSMSDQISSILFGPKGTVESKVQELQERTGLKAFLSQAQDGSLNFLPNLNPELKNKIINFIKNKVNTHHGLISVPAIQEEVFNTFRNEGLSPQDVEAPDFNRYISNSILELQQHAPNNDFSQLGKGVGDSDLNEAMTENQDFWAGCQPAK